VTAVTGRHRLRAFEILKRYSQQHNAKLRDVAQELIDTRKLRGTHGE